MRSTRRCGRKRTAAAARPYGYPSPFFARQIAELNCRMQTLPKVLEEQIATMETSKKKIEDLKKALAKSIAFSADPDPPAAATESSTPRAPHPD